jgi:hypothetical protein
MLYIILGHTGIITKKVINLGKCIIFVHWVVLVLDLKP